MRSLCIGKLSLSAAEISGDLLVSASKFPEMEPRMMAAAERKGYDASEYVPCVHCESEHCPDPTLTFPEIYDAPASKFPEMAG